MIDTLVQELANTSLLELIGFVLAIGYVVLASMENNWCWTAAFISSAIFAYLMLEAKLYSESVLYLYYVIMAVYGYLQWTGRIASKSSKDLPVQISSVKTHLIVIGLGTVLTVVFGLVGTGLGAAMPFLDAFTTAFALVVTWMVTHKLLENWLYWIVLNSVTVYLYSSRGLILLSVLSVVYVILAIYGYLAWRRQYLSDQKG